MIRRFLCFELHDTTTPVAAVAYDDILLRAEASTPELGEALRNKLAAARVAGLRDDPVEMLRYNLPYVTTEATEHPDLASALRF